jgi:twitching motility protein PilT
VGSGSTLHTVLVVDDSETMQQIVAIALAHEPFSLLPALSAAEARAALLAQRPALIVLDHGLPDDSGYDVAAALRKDPTTAAIPVLLLTSEQFPLDADRAAAAGVTLHLQKPFECDDLLVAARNALGIAAPPPVKPAPSPVVSTSTRSPHGPEPVTEPPPARSPSTQARTASQSALPAPSTPALSTQALSTQALSTQARTASQSALPAPSTQALSTPARTASQSAIPGLASSLSTQARTASQSAIPGLASSLPRTSGGVQQLAAMPRLPTPGNNLPPVAPSLPPPFVPTAAPGLPSLSVQVSAQAEHSWLHALLRDAAGQGASDIHVHAMGPMRMRRFGTLWSIPDSALPTETVRRALLSLLSDEDRVRFDADGQIDFGLSLPGAGRFRVNVYRQHKGTDGVFRVVQREAPTLSSLQLPASLSKLTTYHQGIVLLTGPGASGKSSTMAALVRMINEDRADHIVTIEDPIEVVHQSIRCVVNQRQASRHTKSFARALKAALREDPDVIVIGEMRDRETAQLALTAAETGHLVLATLHTQSAVGTINRVIGEFPPAQQPNVRAMLSESLRAVVSQRLLPKKDGSGVVPAVELLVNTQAVANLIREQRTHQIRSTMQTGAGLGMQTLEASLTELVARGVVDLDVARRVAEDPRSVLPPGAAPSTPPAPSAPPAPSTPPGSST